MARQAFAGAAILHYGELRASGARLSDEHIASINAVSERYVDFCHLIRNELSRWPYTQCYFGHLVEARLQQNSFLQSDFIGSLLGETNPIEERLARLDGKVKNLESVASTYGAPKASRDGRDTDEIILDLWNEIFVIDFIMHNPALQFTSLERVVRRRDRPQIDLLALRNGRRYGIEVTRIRKREFIGATHPFNFEAISHPSNRQSLRQALKNKLRVKNWQFRRFRETESQAFDTALLVIKTSQWEYQDGSDVVADVAVNLLRTGCFSAIDEVLLIYDVVNCDWLKKN